MSDLTTLATLSRVLGRAKERLDLDSNGWRALEVILEELHREIDGKPPHVNPRE
jgi:hypothetical protein